MDILEQKNKEIDRLGRGPSAMSPRNKNDESRQFGWSFDQDNEVADSPTTKKRSEDVLVLNDPALSEKQKKL